MNLFKVPYKCHHCKRTGYYLTAIDFDDVQLQCTCGQGAVQTQVPLAIIERDVRISTSLYEEVANEMLEKSKRRKNRRAA